LLRKQSLRILIVCPCPLDRELGAAQIHMNLAEALQGHGHSVRLWTPHPLPENTHWASQLAKMREKVGAFLEGGESFDVVDCPPALLRRRFVRNGVTWVARSVQPDVQYLWEDLRGRRGRSPVALAKTAAVTAWTCQTVGRIYRGWTAANVVLCLGSGEREWIHARLPWLRPKVHSYGAALSEDDSARLARVRESRPPRGTDDGVRYLWIGRWARHKGLDELVDLLAERLKDGTRDRFTVAGCGPSGERALAHLATSPRLRVVASFRRSELPQLLAEHDAGLFTSRSEGWGLVLNEMLESGLPVYATRAGGVDDLRAALGPFVPEFPPPRGARPPGAPPPKVMELYEARFRWGSIAERYVDIVTSAR
jgi:glycosyltransferase involved in cell wall biosynthesis